jgi:multiple sugar transport system substrate-binding protein
MYISSLSRRRLLQSVSLGGLGATVLAACGETITVTKEVPVEVIKEVQVPVEVIKEVQTLVEMPAKKVTLRVSTHGSPASDALVGIGKDFEASTGHTVEFLFDAYSQIQPKHFAEAAAQTGAFDIIGYPYPNIGAYVQGGLLADLKPLFASGIADPDYDIADFNQIVLRTYGEYEVGGYTGLFGLPHKFDIFLGMYRPDLWEAAGVELPGDDFSYADLLDAAAKLAPSQGDDPVITLPLKAGGPTFTNWSAIYRSEDGDYFDENKFPMFTGDNAVAAVEQLRSYLPYMPDDVLTLNFDPALRIMAAGRAAYHENWNGFFPVILDPSQSEITDKVAFIPTPAGTVKRAQELGGWALGVARDSQSKEAAFQLLQALTSRANAVQYVQGGGASARSSVATDSDIVAKFPYYPLMIAALEGAVPRPKDPTWGPTQGLIGNAVNAALQPGQDAKSALVEAAREVYNLVQRQGFTPEATGDKP